MNGYMERSAKLSVKVRKHKTDVEMLKIIKDKAMKEVGEASLRVDVAEKRAEDAKVVLRRAMEENSLLLGIQETLTVEIRKPKT